MPLLSDDDLEQRTALYREIDCIIANIEAHHGRRGACGILAMCLGIQAERAGVCLRRLYTTTRAASGFHASDAGAVDGEHEPDDWPDPEDHEEPNAA